MLINGSQVRQDKNARADLGSRIFLCQRCKKNFCLPSADQGVLDNIFWIYPVRKQDPNFGLEKFTTTAALPQIDFLLRKSRGYVNVTKLNSDIDKPSLSISHFVEGKSIRPCLPHLKKFGQSFKFQNGLCNEHQGKVSQLQKILPRKAATEPKKNFEFALPPIAELILSSPHFSLHQSIKLYSIAKMFSDANHLGISLGKNP